VALESCRFCSVCLASAFRGRTNAVSSAVCWGAAASDTKVLRQRPRIEMCAGNEEVKQHFFSISELDGNDYVFQLQAITETVSFT